MFWFLVVVLLVLTYYYLRKPHQYWKERGVPQYKPWFILGNMGHLALRMRSMSDDIKDLYDKFDSRYYGMYQFLVPTLVLKDPELIGQITVKEFDSFIDHRTLISEESDPLFGRNLLSLKGQKWKDMRSTLSPAFTSSKMKSMFHLMCEIAQQFVDYCTNEIGPTEIRSYDMKDLFTRYTSDVIATCAFGVKVDSLKDRENTFYMMGKDASDFGGSRGLIFTGFLLFPKLMNLFKITLFRSETRDFFRELVKSTMEAREEQNIVRPDMINILMEAKRGRLKYDETKNNVDTGFATVEESHIGTKQIKREWSEDDLIAQAILFFIAGFDSIATLISFMTYELAVNEDVQEKLFAEVDRTLEECNGKITYEAISKMKYMDMIICESLRKWPAAIMTDRVCQRPYTIQPVEKGEVPVHLKKGEYVWIPIYAMHRDPKYYPDPEKFDPERFSDENKSKINPHMYIPFGIGPRNCIGSRFALLEAKVLLTYLISKFKLNVIKETPIPLIISPNQFNPIPVGGFWLGISKRA